MPQTTYLPFYTASYPLLAKVQKPGGVTVLSAVSGGDVPNKHTFVAGTIQSFEAYMAEVEEYDKTKAEAAGEEEAPEEEEEEVEEDDGNGGTVRRKRTVTRTRTTTRRR